MKEFSTIDQPPSFSSICSFFKKALPLIQGPRTGWRLKAKLAIRGTAASPIIGLFRPGSHEAIDLPICPDHHPAIDEGAALLRQKISALGIAPYDEIRQTGILRYAQFFVSRETGKIQLVLVAREKKSALELADALSKSSMWHSIWINIHKGADNKIFGNEWVLYMGEPFLVQNMGRARVSFHPAAFAQANLVLFDRILEKLDQWVPKSSRLIEIYAGVGGISLHLKSHLQSAVLIEDNPFAYLSFMNSWAKDPIFRYIQADAKAAIPYLDEGDCILVDPPRKGLDPELLEALGRLKNQVLIYISCSFQSFQRDAAILQKDGWVIEDQAVYWLFPGTDHVELVVKWKKSIQTESS